MASRVLEKLRQRMGALKLHLLVGSVGLFAGFVAGAGSPVEVSAGTGPILQHDCGNTRFHCTCDSGKEICCDNSGKEMCDTQKCDCVRFGD